MEEERKNEMEMGQEEEEEGKESSEEKNRRPLVFFGVQGNGLQNTRHKLGGTGCKAA